MNDNLVIFDYLAMHSDHFKDLLREEIIDLEMYLQDESLKLFWDDIRHQFDEKVYSLIASDLSLSFNRNFDDMYSLLEQTNIREYLK